MQIIEKLKIYKNFAYLRIFYKFISNSKKHIKSKKENYLVDDNGNRIEMK